MGNSTKLVGETGGFMAGDFWRGAVIISKRRWYMITFPSLVAVVKFRNEQGSGAIELLSLRSRVTRMFHRVRIMYNMLERQRSSGITRYNTLRDT